VLRQGEQYVLAIVPADERIDLSAIRDLIGPGVDLASEAEMSRLFPGCEEGAMPPLGGLYGLPVVADACLAQQEKISINGGTHTDVIELRWEDFERVEHPRMLTH
jgi:Ala-tRNA(Pro) deacylase